MTTTCETCRYFQPFDPCDAQPEGPGECHRHAPKVTFGRGPDASYLAIWPEVYPNTDWCGEHQPKPALSASPKVE